MVSNRVKNDLRILQDYLKVDVEYTTSHNDDDILYIFVLTGYLGETKLPKYHVTTKVKEFINMSDRYDEKVQGLIDMAIGRYSSALSELIKSNEASPERDQLNLGIRDVIEHEVDDDEDKKIKDFKNIDFRSQLNFIDNHFDDIKAVPDFDDPSFKLYYTKGGKETYVATVNADSNVVKVISALKEKAGYEPSSVFVNALRNQIREFKDLFVDEIIEQKKAEQAKLIKESEKKNNG